MVLTNLVHQDCLSILEESFSDIKQITAFRLEVALPSLETLAEAFPTVLQNASVNLDFQLSLRNLDQIFGFLIHSLSALCVAFKVTRSNRVPRDKFLPDSALLLSYLTRFWAAMRLRLLRLGYTARIGSCLSIFLSTLPNNLSYLEKMGAKSSSLTKSVILMCHVFETLLSESMPPVFSSALKEPLCYSLFEAALLCIKSQKLRHICSAYLLPTLKELGTNKNHNNDVIVSCLESIGTHC